MMIALILGNILPILLAASSPGDMSFNVAGGFGQCYSYAKLAALPTGTTHIFD